MELKICAKSDTKELFLIVGEAYEQGGTYVLYSFARKKIILVPWEEFVASIDEPNIWGKRTAYHIFYYFDSPLSLFSTEELVKELFSRSNNPLAGFGGSLSEVSQKQLSIDYLVGKLLYSYNTEGEEYPDFEIMSISSDLDSAIKKVMSSRDEQMTVVQRSLTVIGI
ncbi:MAG: hypothetical protein EOM67_15230 [Spirochaetia bacterium]|nr:hypothetical protein [Spirochaetia bacterium]